MTEIGVVVGKFLPLHLGHDYLIKSAMAHCDQLWVLLIGSSTEDGEIPLAVRESWLREMYESERCHVVSAVSDAPTSTNDPDVIAYWADFMRALTRTDRIDVMFSSEGVGYGPPTAAALGARHQSIDDARKAIPISGTIIRRDPMASWEFLSLPARAWYCQRIRVLGGESTGTTTAVNLLARALETAWVPEWGRAESDRIDFGNESWSTDDFIRIANTQSALEDTYARRARRVLVCDTDPLTTAVWHAEYLASRSADVEALGERRHYVLTFLTDTDIPWVNDGNRNSTAARNRQQDALVERLVEVGVTPIVLSGSREARLHTMVEAVASLGLAIPSPSRDWVDLALAGAWRYVEPRTGTLLRKEVRPMDSEMAEFSASRIVPRLNEGRETYESMSDELGVHAEAVLELDWWTSLNIELEYAQERRDRAAIVRLTPPVARPPTRPLQ